MMQLEIKKALVKQIKIVDQDEIKYICVSYIILLLKFKKDLVTFQVND